jgi:hypothetical protein
MHAKYYCCYYDLYNHFGTQIIKDRINLWKANIFIISQNILKYVSIF